MRFHTATVFSTGNNAPSSGGWREDGAGGAYRPLPAAAAAAASTGPPSHLRHPGPQHSQQGVADVGLDPHARRVVTALLRELDTARQQGAAAAAERVSVKGERQQREQDLEQAKRRGSGGGSSRSGTADPSLSKIKAFRPSGLAPPPKPRPPPQQSGSGRGPPKGPAPNSSSSSGAADVEALQQDNAEMREHLKALLAHCTHLQQRAEAGAAAGRGPSTSAHPPAPRRELCPQHSQQEPVETTVTVTTTDALGAEMGRSRQRSRSPGRATVVNVSSPRAGGADLAVAVFEPAPEDTSELRLVLNRLQRLNLKLSSKLSKAQEDVAERGAESRRWQAAVEQQAGTIGNLRVELQGERLRLRDLEAAVVVAADEVAATQHGAAGLLDQLGAAEAAASAAEGEAAGLRRELAVTEEQRGRALTECERLKEEMASMAARLSATDLVRREAERERDALELHTDRLRAALAEEEASGSLAAGELEAQLGAAQRQAAVERQRGDALQAQLAMAQAQARDTERVLTEQLRAVQEERNTCLAAATRADALLVRLGQHALCTRGVE